MPKAYPPEFRRRALDLIQAGRSVVQVAADLGISQGCLYSWRKQELIDIGELPGLSSVQSAELTAARRRIRELEAENEILRRAWLAFKDVVPPKDRFGLVADQAKALAFYTDVLGFVPKTDIPLGEHRWLTVVSADAPDRSAMWVASFPISVRCGRSTSSRSVSGANT